MANSATFADTPVRQQQLATTPQRGYNASNATFALASFTEAQIAERIADGKFDETALELAQTASLASLQRLVDRLEYIDDNYLTRVVDTTWTIARTLQNSPSQITGNQSLSISIDSKDLTH